MQLSVQILCRAYSLWLCTDAANRTVTIMIRPEEKFISFGKRSTKLRRVLINDYK